MSSLFQIEGVVLQVLKFNDFDQIATLFTPERGLIKIIIKNGYRGKGKWILTPFMQAEFVLWQGRSEILSCSEFSVKNNRLALRESLSRLEAASDMAKVVQMSQWVNKADPELYVMFTRFLDRIPNVGDSTSLMAAFRLKILYHEGLLGSHEGEAVYFTSQEWTILANLAEARSLSVIVTQPVSIELFDKIKRFFLLRIQE
jgi:DNA repair protein RecO (recombination protein O)